MSASDLSLLPSDRPVGLLVRHAERPPLAYGELGLSYSLTEQGRDAARRLGVEIGGRLRSCRTSATLRCRETAELICSGTDVPVVPDQMLGEPSVLIVEPEIAVQNWKRLDNDGVIRHLATSDEALPGMRAAPEAVALLTEHLVRSLAAPTGGPAAAGIHVFVTHDVVLATFVSRTLRLGEAIWPGYLQAAGLWCEGPHLLLAWEGRIEQARR